MPIFSGGYNLIGNVDPIFSSADNSCMFLAQPTDQLGHARGSGEIDPKLGLFGAHGGPTATIPLKSSSSAVNWIPVGALATDGTPLCPISGSTDQRSKPRPQGGACDVGAYETKF